MRGSVARELSKQLQEANLGQVHGVYLIGSQARGDARPYSDIDLLVLSDELADQRCLYPAGELASLTILPLETFMARLYAPEGRQELLDWFWLAGSLQVAQPLKDEGAVLQVARRVIEERISPIRLHSRIYWEEQLGQLAHWNKRLQPAAPFTSDYFGVLEHYIKSAIDSLIIFNGKPLPRLSWAGLAQPEFFADAWEVLWCIGANPRKIDAMRIADDFCHLVKGIWQAVKPIYEREGDTAVVQLRQACLDRIPGQASHLVLPEDLLAKGAFLHIDRYLSLLVAAVKHALAREPALLLSQVSKLREQMAADGLLQFLELARAVDNMRIPGDADPKRVAALANDLTEALRALG